jgi:hypothetical protein
MAQHDGDHQAVRFASQQQEIEPVPPMTHVESLVGPQPRDDLTPEAQEELRTLAMSLQKSRLQTRRMGNFNFEPVSLPVSRVSRAIEDSPHTSNPTLGTIGLKSTDAAVGSSLSQTYTPHLCHAHPTPHACSFGIKRSTKTKIIWTWQAPRSVSRYSSDISST